MNVSLPMELSYSPKRMEIYILYIESSEVFNVIEYQAIQYIIIRYICNHSKKLAIFAMTF